MPVFDVPDILPVGSGLLWYSGTPPSKYLLCDGTAISRTTYAQLFSILGTTYGIGDGSTTFNLPDLRQRVPHRYKPPAGQVTHWVVQVAQLITITACQRITTVPER
jgi:microcystin-dependent protein